MNILASSTSDDAIDQGYNAAVGNKTTSNILDESILDAFITNGINCNCSPV